jgi:hypothetical protein
LRGCYQGNSHLTSDDPKVHLKQPLLSPQITLSPVWWRQDDRDEGTFELNLFAETLHELFTAVAAQRLERLLR